MAKAHFVIPKNYVYNVYIVFYIMYNWFFVSWC